MTVENVDYQSIYQATREALEELLSMKHLGQGDILVIGTSTSEVAGRHIGSQSSSEIASCIYKAVKEEANKQGFYLAFQCCEHLNRALVVESYLAQEQGYKIVSARPAKDAGGAMATYAYEKFNHPVLIENISAQAGIDIGETMIGMHLEPVAVPLRYSKGYIGQARVNMAYTRPKYIGGPRTKY